ncbi:hypothetical protein [Agromyces sp. NPDC055658]
MKQTTYPWRILCAQSRQLMVGLLLRGHEHRAATSMKTDGYSTTTT